MTAFGLRLAALLALTAGVLALAMALPQGRALLSAHRRVLAATIPGVAMLGSLWLSEVVGFVPCRLCWWQRFVMYPLAFVLPPLVVAARPRAAALVGVPAALVGGAISSWHLVVQARPALGGACSVDVPCNVAYVRELGFLTIPGMALLGFVAIAALLAPDLARRDGEPDARPGRLLTTTNQTRSP